VLNYAKLEAARVEFRADEVPLLALLSALEDLVAPQVANKGLGYDCCDAADDVLVLGDEEKIRQILLNLLSNAVKFTAPGGHVSVTSDATPTEVRVHVTDTGVGIPGDQLEAVFEPFVQLSRGLSTGHEGTGLGLAISRDLARGMRGELTARSEVGRGSTFTLVLPRAPGRD
jgi:signal transduction histidine kinase